MRGRATTTPTDTAPHRFLVAARLLINISRHRFALVRVNIGILALLGIETGIVVGLGLGFDAFAYTRSSSPLELFPQHVPEHHHLGIACACNRAIRL